MHTSYLDSDDVREKTAQITSLVAEALFASYMKVAHTPHRSYINRMGVIVDQQNKLTDYNYVVLSSCFRGAYKTMASFCEQNAPFLDFSHEEIKFLTSKSSMLENILGNFCKKDHDEAHKHCEKLAKERDNLLTKNLPLGSSVMERIDEINESINNLVHPKSMTEEEFVEFLAERVQEFTSLLTTKAAFEQLDQARVNPSLNAGSIKEKLDLKVEPANNNLQKGLRQS